MIRTKLAIDRRQQPTDCGRSRGKTKVAGQYWKTGSRQKGLTTKIEMLTGSLTRIHNGGKPVALRVDNGATPANKMGLKEIHEKVSDSITVYRNHHPLFSGGERYTASYRPGNGSGTSRYGATAGEAKRRLYRHLAEKNIEQRGYLPTPAEVFTLIVCCIGILAVAAVGVTQ